MKYQFSIVSKGADFGRLQARATESTNNSVTIKWTRMKGASGYEIFGNPCGKKNKVKLIKTIKGNKTFKLTQKKRKKATYYKYIVVAYKMVDGKKMILSTSATVHETTKGKKYTNPKEVKVDSAEKSVKVGKKVTIKASVVKKESKKKIDPHRSVKFESSNTSVATVNSKGEVTGVKKGTVTIYVYAQNGVYKNVSVTVK